MTLPATFYSIPQTILLSTNYSCSEEILSIVSLLSVDNVLYNPPAWREEVLAARKKFISSEGDHMTLLNIYRAFKKVSGNKVRKMSRAESCWWFAFMIFDLMILWSISVFTGVVPRELCQQQEHGSGERSTGTTQGYLSQGRCNQVKMRDSISFMEDGERLILMQLSWDNMNEWSCVITLPDLN